MAAHPNNRPPEAVVRRATEDDWRGPGESIEERRLVAMWVHPEHRGGQDRLLPGHTGRGVGARRRRSRLVLWVAEGNNAALHLYLRHGFTQTGISKPLPRNPAISERQMVLRLR